MKCTQCGAMPWCCLYYKDGKTECDLCGHIGSDREFAKEWDRHLREEEQRYQAFKEWCNAAINTSKLNSDAMFAEIDAGMKEEDADDAEADFVEAEAELEEYQTAAIVADVDSDMARNIADMKRGAAEKSRSKMAELRSKAGF